MEISSIYPHRPLLLQFEYGRMQGAFAQSIQCDGI